MKDGLLAGDIDATCVQRGDYIPVAMAHTSTRESVGAALRACGV